MIKLIKVVIVEDEEKTRKLIQLMIDWKSMGFLIVGEAQNGQEGLALIRDTEPDLVITDIRMPIMDGLEFAANILKKNPHIKIIVITAYEAFEYAQQGIKLGVFDFLLKPIKRVELKTTLERLKTKIEAENYGHNNKINDHDGISVVDQVLYYMTKNLSEGTLSLSTVATHFFVNASYLSRVFKRQTGVTFVEYLTRMRLEKAVQYLKQTDKKVYEIAELVGISDAAYFGKCFKKYKGMTIHAYKKSKNNTILSKNSPWIP